jgi:hypothetical protein
LPAIFFFEEEGNFIARSAMRGYFEQRSGDISHHLVEKSISFEFKAKTARLFDDIEPF